MLLPQTLELVLYSYYKQALVAFYIPDDPRSFKSICLTCNAHNLGWNITCCFSIELQGCVLAEPMAPNFCSRATRKS